MVPARLIFTFLRPEVVTMLFKLYVLSLGKTTVPPVLHFSKASRIVIASSESLLATTHVLVEAATTLLIPKESNKIAVIGDVKDVNRTIFFSCSRKNTLGNIIDFFGFL
jgi:hypothetical protein